MISIYLLLDFFKNQGVLTHPHNICKFSDESTCTLKKAVKEISCGFKVFLFLVRYAFF